MYRIYMTDEAKNKGVGAVLLTPTHDGARSYAGAWYGNKTQWEYFWDRTCYMVITEQGIEMEDNEFLSMPRSHFRTELANLVRRNAVIVEHNGTVIGPNDVLAP